MLTGSVALNIILDISHVHSVLYNRGVGVTSETFARPAETCNDNYCYDLLTAEMTWTEASRACSGSLASIYTAEDQDIIEGLLAAENFTGDVWIGATEVTPNILNNNVTVWTYVSGELICGHCLDSCVDPNNLSILKQCVWNHAISLYS